MKEMAKVKKERKTGLDLIKTVSCMGVVALHTLVPEKGYINQGILLLCTLCIPLFFMVSGYLMMKRDVLDYRYVLKKVLRILAVCFCWEFLHAAAYLIYYRKMRNFLISFVLDFLQEGLFFHFWYMGALILVYLAMPPLHRLLKKYPSAYGSALAGLSVACVAVDLTAIAVKRQFLLDIPQSLRFWVWLFYAMAGGYAAAGGKIVQRFGAVGRRERIFIAVILLSACVLWQNLIGIHVFGHVVTEAFYGAFFTQLAVGCVFLALQNVSVSGKTAEWILWASGLTMGIYIVHPFVLAVLKKFIPSFTQGGIMNLLFWITTAALSAGISCVIKKIPILKQLVRL